MRCLALRGIRCRRDSRDSLSAELLTSERVVVHRVKTNTYNIVTPGSATPPPPRLRPVPSQRRASTQLRMRPAPAFGAADSTAIVKCQPGQDHTRRTPEPARNKAATLMSDRRACRTTTPR